MTKKAYQSLKGSWARFRGKAGTVAEEVVEGAESVGGEAMGAVKGAGHFVGRLFGPALSLVTGAYDAYETHN
ncbi:hypothetical protein, partial [Serratia sp. 506_PEND]|uniref:hypothetical protein n=1 Tax=Serratia sp. 506_PEND TaxID=1572666 RepID=UPI001955572A